MRIGGFYIITTKGVKTCSNPLLKSEGKCKAAQGIWDYHSPHGESTFKVMPNIPDEKGADFYWTGVLRQSFTEGVPGNFTYKKTCTDASYHNQKDCEDNGSEWSHRGWESGEQYEKNDLVSYYGIDVDVEGDQKLWYYCITENNDTFRPRDGDGNWRRIDLKSYLYEGIDGQNWEPDAYHAYDIQQNKRTHRYNEGGNAVADVAEMGPNEDYSVFNEEDNDHQFYLAAIGHFNIYETCHGTRPMEYQGISGNFNFYNAAYPAGYYSPPYGETPTMTLIGSQSEDPGGYDIDSQMMMNFMEPGVCCPELGEKRELGMWGIKTTFPVKTQMVTWDQHRGDEHAIHAPAEECPPAKPPKYFFEEKVFSYHPGSIMAPGAGTFYNDNPFPNSCDIDGWFSQHVYDTQRCTGPGGEIYNGYRLDSGFPKRKYPTIGSNESKLDAGVCKARMCETTQELEFGFEGVQLGMGDPADPGTAINDQASFASYDASNYWHFIFEYNHKSLWNETENTLTQQVVQFAGLEDGTREDHLWEYRQCPNTPDFLPWSSDCPIHSCPSHYFDIPYYAAIGKFGFYGARFFNICSTPKATTDNERGEEENEYNYYTARKISSDGVTFENKIYDLKGLAGTTAAASSECLRINDACFEVTYVETTTDDRTVDIVIGSTSPAWESKTVNVDLQYDVYEKATSGGFSLGHLNLKETVIWDTVSFNVSACQDCLDGGQAAIDEARLEITKKIEAKLGVSQAEIDDMRNGVGQNYCEAHIPACAPYIHHGSVAFNPSTTLDAPFEYLDGIAATNAFRRGADNIHGSDGQYSTKDSKVDIVIDYPAGVQNCTKYDEPTVQPGVCDEAHLKTLLEIAKNEQRLGEFFVGNIGFFLWANYEHIVDSYEYRHLLTGFSRGDESELRFKSSLHQLKGDFDQMLTSLPNLLNGLDDPVVYYKATEKGLFGNEKLDYSRQGLFNDMLFSNKRYRQFLQETERVTNSSQNLFSLSVSPSDNPNHVNQMDAWNKLLDLYGSHIAVPGGQVNQAWYKTAVEGKEKRVLTRFVENKLRGRSIDLFPTNQITFSTDSASNYISGKHWGNSKWGDSVAGNHMGASFDPLPGGAHWKPLPTEDPDMANPGVSRRYFWGVYTHVSTVTGWHDRIENAKNMGGAYYYGGLYQDFACGGDRPLAAYTAGGIAVGADDRALPQFPWQAKGYNDVGRISHGFSCFSPIFVQQPLNVTCKIGQRPTFRSEAVDYHTIPEDKINKGYPEIDFWTNSLKLTNSRGEFKYPVQYKWYRMLKSTLSPNKPEEDFDQLFHSDDHTIFQEASITGEWACMEGVSGIGAEDCTLFHPQATYTHEMVEGDDPYKIQEGWNGRKYEADHWTKLVDYKGEIHRINSAKKQGPHRLWKSFNYIQGAISAAGRTATDKDLPAVPTFSKNHTYADMMVNKYGLDYSSEYGDDEYLYFCVASGRFGFRRTEAVNLDIEDWIKQDYSIRNGAPVSIPVKSVGFSYTRVDQESLPLPPESQNAGSMGGKDEVAAYNSVVLKKGWGAEATTYQRYNSEESSIPAFGGLQRDANQVWENHVSEKINMHNNCRSYAFVGKEGYRGTTRSLRPPVAGTIQGDVSERSTWFEYGLLYSFGTKLSQAWGNALYSQSQMPICRNYEMPKGCTAQGFQVSMDLKSMLQPNEQLVTTKPNDCGFPTMQTENVNLTSMLSQNIQASAEAAPVETAPRMYHWSVLQSALIVDNLRAGIPNKQHRHHGEHYNFYDDYGFAWQEGGESGTAIAYHGRGVTWQFHNNLGSIKRFGHWVKLPGTAFTHPGSWYGTGTYQDTDDVYFWCWRGLREIKRNFDAAQRLVTSSSLAGVNCGWRMKSCGRYMLYWVEAYQRYYNSCGPSGRVTNLSYISPGLRAGSAACQYFTGGFPGDTYVKRTGLLGPYAYEWKVSPHNRDRNGNGVPDSFYSMRFERPMRLYDPPAIYGLWARQTPSNKVEPQVEAVRKLRNRAATTNGHIGNSTKLYRNPSFTYWGPPGTGNNGGCGAQRIRCVEAIHRRWYRPYRYGSGNVICDWYTYAIKLGADQGWNYGCSEQQLIKGLCFDPCLSMKYNYGFFPGGKLLSLNRYVKYRDSRHNKLDKSDGAGGVLPGASSQEDKSQGQSTVEVDEATGEPVAPEGNPNETLEGGTTPADDDVTGMETPMHSLDDLPPPVDTPPPDPVVIDSQGARFITQLTGDVADEENAITKNKGSKTVRMLRGPWATPYRRIKKTLIKHSIATLGDNLSNSDVINASKTLGIDQTTDGVEKYQDSLNHKPYKKRVTSVYTDTTVSPCNSGGADHCSYLTPTMHLGIDVTIEGFEAVFNNAAINILGRDIGPAGEAGGLGGAGSGAGGSADGGQAEFLRQMQLFTRFLVNGWDQSAGDNPFVDENGQPLTPEQTMIALGEMNPETTITTLEQYIEDNCDGEAGTFFENLLHNMGAQLDPASTTYVEGEIAARAEKNDGALLANSILIELDNMHQNGQLVVI